MRKCANFSPYMRRTLVIYDFATAPFWIFLYKRNILFSFLSVYVHHLSFPSALLADSFLPFLAFSKFLSCYSFFTPPPTSLSYPQQGPFVSLYPVLFFFHSAIIIPFLPIRILIRYHAFPLGSPLFLFLFSLYFHSSFLWYSSCWFFCLSLLFHNAFFASTSHPCFPFLRPFLFSLSRHFFLSFPFHYVNF